ncbi:hypothetical protein [Nocardia salmonicida]|uniref:hypothetical protein n=1 Tax=Nocardia salmonicida TaxID=53431 RepID=UPI0020D2749E|nr:hypothetical protein [Nocardia salmonicida]
MLVSGHRFAAGPATRAFLDAGVRDAGSADTNSVERLINTDNTSASGTGRKHDSGDSGSVQMLDELRDHSQRCSMPVTGEQCGIGFDSPSQFLLIGALPTGLVDQVSDRVPVDSRIEFGDHGVDHRYRITVVDLATLSASRLSIPVDDLHALGLPATGARRSSMFAWAAIPVLPFSGECPQVLAAACAARR